ncbi:MAG: hypothetical protein AB1792_00035 [Candidatus Zixiibacteriota bacterium]
MTPTHADFVRNAIRVTTQNVYSEFPYRRGKPLSIVPDGEQPEAALWFEAASTHELYTKGMLVRQQQMNDTADDGGSWLLRYRLSTCRLELSDPHHDGFLGHIWLKRTVTIGLSVSLWDTSGSEMLWTNTADTTFEDRIPKRMLPTLADPSVDVLSPEAPSTAWERAAAPALSAAAAAGVLAVLFLVVR